MQPFDREVLKGWSAYLKISGPSMVMLASEWWAFESMTVMAGIIGVTALASQTIYTQVMTMIFMLPLGV